MTIMNPAPINIDALKMACAYSFAPNKLGYCGPEGSWLSFKHFLSNPTEQNALSAKKNLQKFNALFPYLELIAKANSLQPFDAAVIEAYWLGNQLLENISHKAIQETILSLQRFGLPKKIAEEKAANLPEGMLPHHSMHVLFVNFINPKVRPIVSNLSNCLIQWAKVESISKKGIKAKGIQLFSESGQLKLKEKQKTIQNPFNLQLQPSDFVSVHWGNAVEKVSSKTIKSLKKYTFTNIKLINNLSAEGLHGQ